MLILKDFYSAHMLFQKGWEWNFKAKTFKNNLNTRRRDKGHVHTHINKTKFEGVNRKTSNWLFLEFNDQMFAC